jgi:hypothetical protein
VTQLRAIGIVISKLRLADGVAEGADKPGGSAVHSSISHWPMTR